MATHYPRNRSQLVLLRQLRILGTFIKVLWFLLFLFWLYNFFLFLCIFWLFFPVLKLEFFKNWMILARVIPLFTFCKSMQSWRVHAELLMYYNNNLWILLPHARQIWWARRLVDNMIFSKFILKLLQQSLFIHVHVDLL